MMNAGCRYATVYMHFPDERSYEKYLRMNNPECYQSLVYPERLIN